VANPQRSITAQNALTPRKRYTKKQIQERRVIVWEMTCCGSSLDEIALKCGVSEKTTRRDMAWWEDRLGYKTTQLKDPKNAAIDVGMTAAMLKQMSQDAYVEFVSSTNATFKVRYLEAAGRLLVNRHKILADAGFLPKVGHEIEEAHSVKVSFEARFGKDAPQAVFDDAKSRRKVLEAVFGALSLGIGADGLPSESAEAMAALTLDVESVSSSEASTE